MIIIEKRKMNDQISPAALEAERVLSAKLEQDWSSHEYTSVLTKETLLVRGKERNIIHFVFFCACLLVVRMLISVLFPLAFVASPSGERKPAPKGAYYLRVHTHLFFFKKKQNIQLCSIVLK